MITIYLGDTSEYLSVIARAKDIDANLITEKNYQNLSYGTYYTSIGDIGGLSNFGKLLQQANKVIYAPPPNDCWTGGKKMKYWTEEYLKIFSFRCSVENFEILLPDDSAMTKLVDQRKSENSQIWIAGCSISHGIGIEDHERYGKILSSKLCLPVSFLTCPASSISWAADQILRSDIRSKDIVIWGLTADCRLPYFINDTLRHVNRELLASKSEFDNILNLDDLDSQDTLYRNLISILQVQNFCQKLNATLIVASLIDTRVIFYLRDLPNLVVLSNLWGRNSEDLFLDLGTDLSHPGAMTHEFYAREIYKKILELVD